MENRLKWERLAIGRLVRQLVSSPSKEIKPIPQSTFTFTGYESTQVSHGCLLDRLFHTKEEGDSATPDSWFKFQRGHCRTLILESW